MLKKFFDNELAACEAYYKLVMDNVIVLANISSKKSANELANNLKNIGIPVTLNPIARGVFNADMYQVIVKVVNYERALFYYCFNK